VTLALLVEPRAARWQQVLPLLRRAILSGQIEPGTRLVPEQIAAASGVSRGPVTDAIRRLSEEGLVTIATNGRPFVRGLTMKDFHDLNAFRANLEVFAARTALEKDRTPDLKAMRLDVELMHRFESRETIEQLADADVAFHQHLIALADNPVADRAFAAIAEFTRSLLSVSDWLITPEQIVARAHASIVDALDARDLPSLEAAIAAHYRLSSETMTAAGLVNA
jgi:DNA-binding GntR family transcriptional regulator